jgi:hypothetical protein
VTEFTSQFTSGVSAAYLCRGEVVEVEASGAVVVTLDAELARLRCEVLVTSDESPPLFSPADRVLVWAPPAGGSAVVLGRIGPSPAPKSKAGEPPETLVIEARQSLILRVGAGSITIREDGKILIKGKDLVSHAQRVNRIKGGSVAIN